MVDFSQIQYRNSPIVEVVCEFQFTSDHEWDETYPTRIHELVSSQFPRRDILKLSEVKMALSKENISQNVKIVERPRFLQEDETTFIQVGQDLLAINRLKPYPTWDAFFPSIVQAYNAYSQVATPKSIKRIGLRYINRIEFQVSEVDLDDYFTMAPQIPPELPQMLGSYAIGMDIPFEQGRSNLKLQFTSVPPDLPSGFAALLDLDYSLVHPEDIALSQALDWVDMTAHIHIQAAFEACLTSKLRATFEPASE